MGAIFSLSEKRVFAVAVNHDGFYRILRASVNVKMKAKCANQIQKVHKRRADMAGVTHKGIIGGFPSRGLLTRTFPPFHELKCAWVRHPDGEQEFGAAGYRGVLTSEKGGKVQLYYSTFALSRLWRRICLRARRLFSIPSGMGRQQAEAEAKDREEVKDI